MHAKTLLSLASLGLLVSCGWVDSTGRSSNSSPVTQISFDGSQQSGTTQVNELASVRVQASGSDSDGSISSYEWSNQPVRQGALSECAAAGSDFDINIAANSLQEACASPNACSLAIEKQSDAPDGTVEFLISAPDLQAPVGVTYELIATDNDGGVGTQQTTFCLIAINAAPEAEADSFTALEGTTLAVGSAPERNLLTNDTDDIHVLNMPLSVLLAPKRPPTRASTFTLRADGGFTYVPLPTSISADITDSFEYWITDGVHEPVSAEATVHIVAKDDPPVLVDDIPLVEAVAGVFFEFDVSAYFEDPEGSDLNFAIVGGSLPQSGALTLSALGVLSGAAELFDAGNYSISIAASDGSSGAIGALNLVVLDNLPVEAIPITAQTADAGTALILDVSDRFEDPEGEPLTYFVETEFADATLTIDADTGVLRAVFNDDGRYTIDVSASDGITLPTSIRFVVTVALDNSAPIFRGTIANQSAVQGDIITPITGIFTDADDDVLEYTAIGTLPTGLSLSSTGAITGSPTRTGLFAGIRIVATDPFGEFARSNAFSLTVVAAPIVRPANTAPLYTDGTVFNQGILLGAPITPVRPEFTDADGDALSYRILGGALPVGVTINRATGVVSGTPEAIIWQQGIQVLATDPSGGSAASEEFWIRVR